MCDKKPCISCDILKPPEDFSMNGRFRKLSCKSCLAAIYRERYKDSRMIAKERAGNVAFNAFMAAWIPRGMNT